ncbi:MAG: hypothetical protein ACM3TN_10930 [Alphaproteobacteria bacterium]
MARTLEWSFLIGVTLFFLAAVWFGCGSTPQASVARAAPAENGQEALAIVIGHEARDVERDAFKCVRDALEKSNPGIRLVTPDQFRGVAFPDLPPEAAVYSSEYLALLLNHPVFRERLASLGIRYVVALRGVTEQAVVGAAAGAPAALIVWDRNTRLTASVLDLAQSRVAGELNASAAGNPWVLIVGGLPLVVPAETEATACAALGQAVVNFLAQSGKATP